MDENLNKTYLFFNPWKPNLNLRPLKQFVSEKLEQNSALRFVLLNEKDEVPAIDFIPKMQIWLTLLSREKGR
jgi:hypothetical protein